MMLLITGLITFGVSWALTRVVRLWALRSNLLDVPNERSSHSIPTPRGGGVAFVICFVFGLLFLSGAGVVPFKTTLATAGMGSLVAVLGFFDDKYHLPAKWRLACHLLLAALTVLFLVDASQLPLFQGRPGLVYLADVCAIIYLVWLLNLFNFMDGIDGLAASETLCICIGAAVLYALGNYPTALFPPLMLAAAVTGFLVWNFPPARIFMGDAGSGFLGFVIGVFSLQALDVEPRLFWCWLILTGLFITDATVTLIWRAMKGERLFEAHRTHAYQMAAQRFGQHRIVTLGAILINVFWLFPMALLVQQQWLSGFTGLVLAYLPLVALVVKFKQA